MAVTPLELGGGAAVAILLIDRVLNWTIKWKRDAPKEKRCIDDTRMQESMFTVEQNHDLLSKLDCAMQEQAKASLRQVMLLEQLVELSKENKNILHELIAVVKKNGNHL